VKKDSYEFSYMSDAEKRKLMVAKTILLASIIFAMWSLIHREYSVSSSAYFDGAWVLAAVFAYVNLLKVKSELVELFEHPLDFHGKEFLAAGLVLFSVGLFVQFR
jgi:hypothetical protein